MVMPGGEKPWAGGSAGIACAAGCGDALAGARSITPGAIDGSCIGADGTAKKQTAPAV
jgi:hypothetical protein